MKTIITFLIYLLLPFALTAQQKKMLSFSFSLPADATVSAGVYRGEVLLRTLFSNKKYSAGKHNESYAALDDDMNPITSTDGLTVKVLSNNVKYEWEGVIGNTSMDKSGAHIHRGFNPIHAIAINGRTVYYSKHYSEGSPAQNKFSLDTIQRKTRLFAGEPRGVGQQTNCIATDGKFVYWGGADPFGGKTNRSKKFANYIFATTVYDDKEVLFSKGEEYKNGIGRLQRNAIDITTDSLTPINGLAVQRNGKFLFVSHRSELHVLDKSSGELQKVITMPVAGLAVDMKDNLWIVSGQVVKKYSVSNDGSIASLLSLSSFERPVAVAVSPDDKTVVVADAGRSQQLKAFDNITGTSEWTFGRLGGYYTSAAVADDKFYFSDNRKTYGVSISFQNDGSFWLVDGGNYRVQHYTANRKFVERIMYLPHHYNMYVDPKVPEKVFCDYMEFEIDYSKPLLPNNGSWTFVNNWGAVISKNLYNQFMSFRPMKMPNGRTYSLLSNKQQREFEVVELSPADTMRFTGTSISNKKTGTFLHPDGNLYQMPTKKVGLQMVFMKYPLVGFNASNDPIWDNAQVIATITSPGTLDPAYSGNGLTLRPGEITSNNILIVFDGSGRGEGFHLGGVKVGGDSWTWRSARGTTESYRGEFPTDGSYDIGNGVQYAGNVALALGKNVFWGYHGEFWKSSQTNKWNHLYENGLMLGQFGVTGPEVEGREAAPQMAGNVLAASVVQVADNIYLYHNDEGHHSGIHRWKVTGLNTIKEQTVGISLADDNGSKAIRGSAKRVSLDNGSADSLDGWIKEPTKDIIVDKHRNWWTVKTGTMSHNRFEETDISIRFRQKVQSEASLSKTLGFNNTNNWVLSGEVNYDGNAAEIEVAASKKSAGGQYFEVLDGDGKVIFRFFPLLNKETKNLKLIANGTTIAEGDQGVIKKQISTFCAFTLKVVNGKLFFKYGSFAEKSIPLLDSLASAKTPATARFYFWAKAAGANRVISFRKFEFLAQ